MQSTYPKRSNLNAIATCSVNRTLILNGRWQLWPVTLRRVAALKLRPVVAIDRDIFFGEVAGQHAVAAFAQAKRDLERDLGLLHRSGNRGLIIAWIARALVGNADAAEPNRQLVAVGGLTSLANGHHHPAPVGVLAGDRGLDQRGIGDRQRDAARRFF